MSKRHKTRQIRIQRNDRAGAVTVMTALEALCRRRGLLASEAAVAETAGLDARRWAELGHTLADGSETLHPRGAEISAAIAWACGGEACGGSHAAVRALLRRHRLEVMAPSLRACWPRKGKEGARAWRTIEDWRARPHALAASERTLLREIWRARAAMCHYDQDLEALGALVRNPGGTEALAAVCEGEDALEGLGETLSEEPLDRGTAEAVLYAAEESLRGAGEDGGRLASLWLKGRALEHMGLAQRAIATYAKIEAGERAGPAPGAKPSEIEGPRPGEARTRQVWLMWTSGDPDTMAEALEMGVRVDDGRVWSQNAAKEWNEQSGHAQLARVREALGAARRAQDTPARERARAELAEAYLDCSLHDRALSSAWTPAGDAQTEGRLARCAARSAVATGKAEHTVKMLWDRALAADPHDAVAMLGLASREADLGNPHNAALWATRALWTDRRTRTLDAGAISEASEILAEDERYEASARADRRLMRERGNAPLAIDVAVAIADRALERGDERWEDSMDEALDAIAVHRAGLATLCILSARTLRERAERALAEGAEAQRAEAEALRGCVRRVLARPSGRRTPVPDPQRRFVRRALASESRRRMRVLARLPEPLALGMRAGEAAGHAEDPEGALRAGTDERTAALWEEWALRLEPSGHPTDARAQREIERMRRARGGKREEAWEWEHARTR